MLPTIQILYEAGSYTPISAELKQKSAAYHAYQDQIREQFGLTFVNGMDDALNDYQLAELDRAFEQGFLAAWNLWAEVCSVTSRYRT